MKQVEICWGYSCHPYQDTHIRKQSPDKIDYWAVLSECERHTDNIWQDQGITRYLHEEFPNCYHLLNIPIQFIIIYIIEVVILCFIGEISIIFS